MRLHCLVVKSITKCQCHVSWFGWVKSSYKLQGKNMVRWFQKWHLRVHNVTLAICFAILTIIKP